MQARIDASSYEDLGVVSLKKLGRYDLVRVLGKGAMGVVYEGRDPNLERRVAIKTVKVENLSEEAAAEYEARFRTEARSAARLQHPNIVSVYDSDRDGDIAFLVMEYIQGDDLKHHLDQGVRYSLEQSMKMVRDLLGALDYAHKAGIVHRDIKPANLLIEPGGRVKLTDFGVARIQDSGEATRTQGSMVGTLKYMSPEQVQGLKIDSRADLFSVGVVLYQLLTDKRPFDGDNDFSIIHQIIGHTPPPPSSFNSKLPTAIDAVVARSLAKDREQRFATARDFASALQSAIRRAEDATVVPPADPFKKVEAAASSQGTVPSMAGSATSGTSGTTATVTQELELVYWKDIKDSAEPEEFEGFLLQFPAGIYADLARRRLRKLAGVASADQTVLTGQAGATARESDPEATRLRIDASVPMAPPLVPPSAAIASGLVAASHAAAVAASTPGLQSSRDLARHQLSHPGAIPAQSSASVADTVAEPVRAQPAEMPNVPAHPAPAALTDETTVPPQPRTAAPIRPPLASMVAAAAAVERPAEPSTSRAAPPAARKLPVAMLAGIGAIAVAGLAAFLLFGRGADKQVVAAPPAPAASRPAAPVAVVPAPALVAKSPPAVSNVAVAAPAAVEVVPSVAAPALVITPAMPRATHLAASAPRKPVSSSRRNAAAATMAASPPPMSTPFPSEARESREPVVVARPAPAAVAAANRLVPPSESCKDRVFLSRQLCLQQECAKPVFFTSPTCIRFKEEGRLREDSKIRN